MLGSRSPPTAGIDIKEGDVIEDEYAEGGGGDGAGHAAPCRRPLRRYGYSVPVVHIQLPQLAYQRLVI